MDRRVTIGHIGGIADAGRPPEIAPIAPMAFGLRSPMAARSGWILRAEQQAMADLNAVLTRLNDRLLRLEGELFVLRSLARATLTAGDDHAERMRKLVEAARVALDDEALRPLDKPTRKYVEAASAMVDELLVEPTKARPLFTVIDGGKSS
nr:hypothetical protein [Bradyrhizobium stylosanthis]